MGAGASCIAAAVRLEAEYVMAAAWPNGPDRGSGCCADLDEPEDNGAGNSALCFARSCRNLLLAEDRLMLQKRQAYVRLVGAEEGGAGPDE